MSTGSYLNTPAILFSTQFQLYIDCIEDHVYKEDADVRINNTTAPPSTESMTTPPEIPITQSPRRVSHPTVSLRANPPTQAPSLNRSKTVSISVSPWVLFQSFTLEYLPKLHTRSGNRVFPNYSLPNPSLLSTPCFLHLRRWRSWSIVDPI